MAKISNSRMVLLGAIAAVMVISVTAYAITIMTGDVITANDISATTQETYTYDANGRVTNVSTDGVLTETFTYDQEGNVTGSTAQ